MSLFQSCFSALSVKANVTTFLVLVLLAPLANGASAQTLKTFKTLVNFDPATQGIYPTAGLVEGQDGNFYGTTSSGGNPGIGTIFKVTPQGQFTTLVNFNGSNGAFPLAGLILGEDGNFYGTTLSGGSGGQGTVFKITPSGQLTTLANFNGTNGNGPSSVLLQGSDGKLYGTTQFGGSSSNCNNSFTQGCGTVFTLTLVGELTTLVNFDNTNGSAPQGGLIQGSDGYFYGTTAAGGSSTACFGGVCGTVFRLTTQGTLTTLVNFVSTNGASPTGLIEGDEGNFYGTTSGGGSSTTCFNQFGGAASCGTIFKVTRWGKLTTLVNLDYDKGGIPLGRLIQASNGNFYGTTTTGGMDSSDCTDFNLNPYRCGTVFRVTPRGKFKSLVKFDGFNGSFPVGSLLESSNGKLYGTTEFGGSGNSCSPQPAGGCGTVFRLRGAILDEPTSPLSIDIEPVEETVKAPELVAPQLPQFKSLGFHLPLWIVPQP